MIAKPRELSRGPKTNFSGRLGIALLIGMTVMLASCDSSRKDGFRIGIDFHGLSKNQSEKESCINGFLDDLLLEVSKESGLELRCIRTSAEGLLGGLAERKYDAILSLLPPYPFYVAKYDFSQIILDTGTVFVVPSGSSYGAFDKMSGRLVGVLTNDPCGVLREEPSILTRQYQAVPDAFEALARGDVDALLLDRLTAVGYINGLYAGQMTIVEPSLDHMGLRLVSLKGNQSAEIKRFDKTLHRLQKKKKVRELLAKWQLSTHD